MSDVLPPRLTVSIVSHGNSPQLFPLLASLRLHERASELQLIVTDNLGNDLPAFDPSPWNLCMLLRNKNPESFARNHNAAARYAQGEYFCVLNPDVLFLHPVFEALISRIEAGQGDIVAPLVLDPAGRIQDSFRPLPTPLGLIQRRLSWNTPEPAVGSSAISPDWIAGFFLLMRTSIYLSLGGMDEHYRLYLEDVDLCTRARLKGLSMLVDPALRLQHDARRSSRRNPRYFLWHLASTFRFFSSKVYRQARFLR